MWPMAGSEGCTGDLCSEWWCLTVSLILDGDTAAAAQLCASLAAQLGGLATAQVSTGVPAHTDTYTQ